MAVIARNIKVAIMVCVLGFGFMAYGYYLIKLGEESTGWPVTEGKVLLSEVVKVRSTSTESMASIYRANINYSYSVDGEDYSSNRVDLSGIILNRYSAENKAKLYPKDKVVSVYYKPSSADIAVLEPGAKLTVFIPTIFGFTLLVSSLCFMLYVFSLRSTKQGH